MYSSSNIIGIVRVVLSPTIHRTFQPAKAPKCFGHNDPNRATLALEPRSCSDLVGRTRWFHAAYFFSGSLSKAKPDLVSTDPQSEISNSTILSSKYLYSILCAQRESSKASMEPRKGSRCGTSSFGVFPERFAQRQCRHAGGIPA